MNNEPTSAALKLGMIKASLRCLVFGLLGLLPIIGLPFALAAFWPFFQARKLEKHLWNPAKTHRIIGLISAILGALIWSSVDLILIHRIYEHYTNHYNY